MNPPLPINQSILNGQQSTSNGNGNGIFMPENQNQIAILNGRYSIFDTADEGLNGQAGFGATAPAVEDGERLDGEAGTLGGAFTELIWPGWPPRLPTPSMSHLPPVESVN
jgi:hypothetical protein